MFNAIIIDIITPQFNCKKNNNIEDMFSKFRTMWFAFKMKSWS